MTADAGLHAPGAADRGHPDFMVIGAMRSGTKRLHEILAQHPQVHMSTPKETQHYARAHYRGFRGPGDQWVASQVVEDHETYLRLLAPRPPALVSGEASATYLYLPGVLDRVVADFGAVKFVVILREPAQRAHSSYWYLRSQGRERLARFEDGLAAEDDRRRAGYGPMWHYVAAGRYAAQLRRCHDLVGAGNVFVSLTDRLRDDPAGLLGDLCAFLGVAPLAVDGGALSNVSGVPRSQLANRVLYPPDALRRALRTAAPALVTTVRRLRRRNLAEVPPMRTQTARRLRAAFAADVAATAQLTGLDLARWGY